MGNLDRFNPRIWLRDWLGKPCCAGREAAMPVAAQQQAAMLAALLYPHPAVLPEGLDFARYDKAAQLTTEQRERLLGSVNADASTYLNARQCAVRLVLRELAKLNPAAPILQASSLLAAEGLS